MPKPHRVIHPKEPQKQVLTLSPAYGRRYSDEAAARADWNGGADFYIASGHLSHIGRYTSIRDVATLRNDYRLIRVCRDRFAQDHSFTVTL